MGLCLWIEGALDEGQQRQFGRHLAPFDLFDDVVQVASPAPDHALHVLRLTGVELLPLGHAVAIQVRHDQALSQTGPQAAPVGVLVGVESDAWRRRAGSGWRLRGLGRCQW